MPAPPTQGSGQYDFIMGTSHRPVGPKLANTSGPIRIFLVVGGIILLLVVGLLFESFLHKSSGNDTATLLAILQDQTELTRISQEPVDQAAQPSTQDFAQTTRLSLMTEQSALLQVMKNHNLRVATKALTATKNTNTDTELSQAKTTGTYDATYVSIAQDQLTTYQHALSTAYSSIKSASERQALQTAYEHAKLLITMSKQSY